MGGQAHVPSFIRTSILNFESREKEFSRAVIFITRIFGASIINRCGERSRTFYRLFHLVFTMQELARKLIHVIFGLGIAGIVLVVDHTTAIAVLAGGLFFGMILIDLILSGSTIPVFSAIVNYVDRSDPLPGKGALYFAVSALTCVILFPVAVAVPALVSLAVLDGVATIAGIRFGRTRIYNGKSLEGTVTGIFVTFLVLLLFISIQGALIVAVIAGIIEMFSPVDDNLVIPIGICFLLTVFPALI
jgi:phytol kinase